MKNILILIIAIFALQLSATAQQRDYCGTLKVSAQNVEETAESITFDVYLRSGKASTEECGVIYLGHTDIWITLKQGDYSKAKIERIEGNNFTAMNDQAAQLTQMMYDNGTTMKILGNRLVFNIQAPSASNQSGFETMVAELDDTPKAHKLGQFKVSGYTLSTTQKLTFQKLDDGFVSKKITGEGYEKFPTVAHTIENGGTFHSSPVLVLEDHFLGDYLKGFDAEKHKNASSLINWTIEGSESGNVYILERSKDQNSWEQIHQRDGGIDKYEYLDEGVYNGKQAKESFYYRLRIESENGDWDYSETKRVDFTRIYMTDGIGDELMEESWEVYPNPSTEGIYVQINRMDDAGIDGIAMYDSNGKLVYQLDIHAKSNKEYIDYNAARIESGVFVLQLRRGEEVKGQQMIEIFR